MPPHVKRKRKRTAQTIVRLRVRASVPHQHTMCIYIHIRSHVLMRVQMRCQQSSLICERVHTSNGEQYICWSNFVVCALRYPYFIALTLLKVDFFIEKHLLLWIMFFVCVCGHTIIFVHTFLKILRKFVQQIHQIRLLNGWQ